jgi:hypothetical protein
MKDGKKTENRLCSLLTKESWYSDPKTTIKLLAMEVTGDLTFVDMILQLMLSLSTVQIMENATPETDLSATCVTLRATTFSQEMARERPKIKSGGHAQRSKFILLNIDSLH